MTEPKYFRYNLNVMQNRVLKTEPETDVFVDPKNGRKSVVITLTEYKKLLKKIEDLEDALSLDEAQRTATEFVDYAEFRKELKKTGRL